MTPKRRAFVNAYLTKAAGNATQAAIIAGYSEATAPQIGSRLLRQADVKEAIGQRLTKADVTTERVLQEAAAIAFSDPRKLFDERGNLKPIHELDDDAARAIASVEVTKERTIREGSTTTQEAVTKVKSWDKVKALEMLGRHLALWNDKQSGEGKVVVNIGFLNPTTTDVVVMPPQALVPLPEK